MKLYTSLKYIPLFNYVRCLNGDFFFMEVGERNQNDLEYKNDNGEYSEEDLKTMGIAFQKMLENYDGKRSEKAVAMEKKYSRVKNMQAKNELIREYEIAESLMSPLFDKEDFVIFRDDKRSLEKEAKKIGLKFNSKTNNRIIQRFIDDLEKNIDSNDTMTIDSMMSSIVSLHTLLGVTVDEMTCTAAKFFEFQRVAGEKVKQMIKQQQNGRL